MIVWFNCKITDNRLTPQPRFHLRDDNRFDVARYSFASMAPLTPLVSKFIFNLELADQHAGREQEMEDWLRSLFPADKLELHWHRLNYISQWRELREHVKDLDDPLIFPAGNEDHVFMDSNIKVFAEALRNVADSQDPSTVFGVSHWPESIRGARVIPGQIDTPHCKSLYMPNNDAIRVMKKEFFYWYVDQIHDENQFLFRTEHWNGTVLPRNHIVIPNKEQFRHFDGYAHVKIGPDICPPIEIPPKFFEGEMVIRYGFKDRDNNCVNINPLADNLYTVDPINGADYKFTLDDIPAFWRPRIKDIIVADNIDHAAMAKARDEFYINMSKIKIDWSHIGLMLDETNEPPIDWLRPNLLTP